MALTLIATAGASDANSYATVVEADAYHEEHLYATNWSSAATATQDIALVWATRLLDEMMEWSGRKNTQTQALRWPRSLVFGPDGYPVDSSVIPQFLKDATAEFARKLIEEDRTDEGSARTLKGFKKLVVGPIELTVDAYTEKPVMPPSVWSIIKFYGRKIGQGGARYLQRV